MPWRHILLDHHSARYKGEKVMRNTHFRQRSRHSSTIHACEAHLSSWWHGIFGITITSLYRICLATPSSPASQTVEMPMHADGWSLSGALRTLDPPAPGGDWARAKFLPHYASGYSPGHSLSAFLYYYSGLPAWEARVEGARRSRWLSNRGATSYFGWNTRSLRCCMSLP